MTEPVAVDALHPPLELDLDGEVHVLHSLAAVESVLARVRDAEPTAGGDRAADAAAAERIRPWLGRLAGNPARADECLRELGPDFFSGHPGWSALFDQVRGLAPGSDPIKVLSLARYRQYLVARAAAVPDREPAPAAGFVTQVDARMRLPRGVESRFVGWPQGQMPMWLGDHRFALRVAGRPSVTDPSGRTVALREGRNLVGRAPVNEVVVAAEYVQVSRRHLVVEVRDGAIAALTDLSSRGTFVPRGSATAAG